MSFTANTTTEVLALVMRKTILKDVYKNTYRILGFVIIIFSAVD